MNEQLDREYCDYIRKHMDRHQIQQALEGAGFGVYDKEPTEELVYALAEHCITEGINPEEAFGS